MMFAPPMPTPRLLAPLVPVRCTLPPAIVLPPISAIAIPSVVRTRWSGAQSGDEYGSGSEKKSRSVHGSLPSGVCNIQKNETVPWHIPVLKKYCKEQRRSEGLLP
jgi:hypothetical protein